MMTTETSRFVRWLVIIVLTAATVGMVLISMRANYLYGRGIGQTPETKEAIAWANVGADLWKGFGLIVVAALWRGGRRRAALATSSDLARVFVLQRDLRNRHLCAGAHHADRQP